MIYGEFGSSGQLFFDIDLISADRLHFPVQSLFDTGFTGYLAINEQDLDALNWSFLREENSHFGIRFIAVVNKVIKSKN